jgi:hypothetical protein
VVFPGFLIPYYDGFLFQKKKIFSLIVEASVVRARLR